MLDVLFTATQRIRKKNTTKLFFTLQYSLSVWYITISKFNQILLRIIDANSTGKIYYTYKNNIYEYTSIQVYTYIFYRFGIANNITILSKKPSIRPSDNSYYNIGILKCG